MKPIKQILLTIVVLLFSVTAKAYDFKVDGIYYNIISATDFTAEVCDRDGDEDYTGDIVIPSTVIYDDGEYSVIFIGEGAFYYSTLTSIEIPNSVTEIGESAFEGCHSLTNVIFGENSQLTSIGGNAFRYCTSLTSIEIPNSVTSIGSFNFDGCSSLKDIIVPNSVTRIEKSTFRGCSSLASVTLGYSVENIGESAFSGCSNLSSIYMTGIPPKVGDANFTYAQYMNTTLYVPQGLLSKYQSAEVWENFMNIKEYDSTGIEDDISIEVTSNGISLSDSEGKPVAIYAINGILVKKIDNYNGEEITLNKGVYIVSVGNKAIKIML